MILIFLLWCSCASAQKARVSTNSVWEAIYAEQRSGGCYLLLNSTGRVGCAASDNAQHAQAPLLNLKDLILPLTEPRAVLVAAHDAQPFILHLQQKFEQQQQQGSHAASHQGLTQHVKAVLVLQEDGAPLPVNQSSALPFPGGQEWAPYFGASTRPRAAAANSASKAAGTQEDFSTGAGSYVWNPFGSGLSSGYLPIPVFKVFGAMASDAWKRADENARNVFRGPSHWVEAELTMQATQPNSSACLQSGTCKPLGGFNVWAAMPPLPFSQTTGLRMRSGKPITLVTAQVDANAFFHEDIQAADSPLSGLLAMLMAMQILKDADASNLYTRQLVFVALAGEPWGYMGSRRLLWDMHRAKAEGSPYVSGLELDDIDQIIELGSIGRAFDAATHSTRLFAHSQAPGGIWGNASQLIDQLQQSAAAGPWNTIRIQRADATSNPGLPPSSLYSFLRVKPGIAGVLLAEYDRQYINPYYHGGPYDNTSFVSMPALAATAASLATALHSMASKGTSDPPPPLKVNMTNLSLFGEALVDCLTMDTPGMDCKIARELLDPDYEVSGNQVSYAVNHYIGVLSYIHSDPQNPFLKKTIYRFLWNLMGVLAVDSESREGGQTPQRCAFASQQCPAGMECIGWKGGLQSSARELGTCIRTTVQYSPSLSTSLDFVPCDAGSAEFQLTNASDVWSKELGWPADPLWTESDWPNSTPLVRITQRESHVMEVGVLTGGVLVATTVALLSWYAREQK